MELGGGVTSTATIIPTHDNNIEDSSIVNDMSGEHGSGGDAYAAYLAEGPKEGDRNVIFSTELGLAVESPPPGMTLAQLWVAL